MRRSKLSLWSIALVLAAGIPMAGWHIYQQAQDGTLPAATLVVDGTLDRQLPKAFRTCREAFSPIPLIPPSQVGLAELRVSGSGQFSEAGLLLMLPHLEGKIYIVDLRQESHGFINGTPVSWYAKFNRLNAERNNEAIRTSEKALLRTLAQQQQVEVQEIVDKQSGELLAIQALSLPVERVESEQMLVERLGLHYERFFVLDHHRPSDAEVDRFVQFVQQLPADAWLHFHCRGGRGRTSTFMVLYDILRNAKQISFQEIMRRQILLKGKDLYARPDEPHKVWKAEAAQARRQFLEQFYRYVTDPQGLKTCTWSEWASQPANLIATGRRQ